MVQWSSERHALWRIIAAIGFILFTSAFACASESAFQVWKVGDRRWTLQEENQYAKWVASNISEDFFIRYQIPVDCADVPYAVRWIYARMKHLPAAATTVDNRLLGHWSRDWGHLPSNEKWYKDRRFRAALLFMLAKTSTRSLPADTYSIRVSSESIGAGTVFFIAESHAGIVGNIVMDGNTSHPVQTLEATMPCRVRKLYHREFVLPDPDMSFHSGLVKFRWPIENSGRWRYLPVKKHPFYSEEQYAPAFKKGYENYLDAVAKRIDPKVYDPLDRINRALNVLADRVRERIPIVLAGNRRCQWRHCPEGSRLWEIYSTPGRDDVLYVTIQFLQDFMLKNHIDGQPILDKMEEVHFQISPDRIVNLKYVFQNAGWMSSNPEATISARWGLEKCGMIMANLTDARRAIEFIKKAYGRKDPGFAERSLWVQENILDAMEREARSSNCTISVAQKN
jgi:hypothetical protein